MTTVSDVLRAEIEADAELAASRGRSVPTGLRACARDASVAATDSDGKNGRLSRRERRAAERRAEAWMPLLADSERDWPAAVWLLERIRSDIRWVLSEEDAAVAWPMVVDALERVQADLRQRFGGGAR